MKKGFKFCAALLSILLLAMLFTACAKPAEETTSSTEPSEEKIKMAIISNRSFGDKGPIDSMAEVIPELEEMGFECKTLESLTPDVYEEDIRAMAKAGYEVIVTSFSPVSEAVIAVAKDYPDTKFVSIYQYINSGDVTYDNIWSTEYKVQEVLYILGCLQGKLTKTNKVGMISGQETATSNAAVNGFMEGVLAANPDCEVEYMYADTYDDPTVGREIALAMISRGIDCITSSCGKTSTGVVEACQENDAYCTADNSDYFEMGENTLVTHLLTDFGQDVLEAARDIKNGTFKGGQHTIKSIFNDAAIVVWDTVDRFCETNPDKADAVREAVEFAQSQQEKLVAGEIEIEFNTDAPTNITKD